MSYKDEPFIVASQARQIFYVTNLVNHKWSVVFEGRAMHTTDDEDSLDILKTSSFSSRTIKNKVDDVSDEIHATSFKSYLGVMAKTHVPIVATCWDDVPQVDKNLLWQNILVCLRCFTSIIDLFLLIML
ncbi:hypothetical protein LR48_Vigan553s002900 [Vigna angularis]|uniref:DUF4216 domain-containing protein n=1 Tax=Phaseolus angularis TaxID=3914 RepID=A0A0L9TDB9_PHAAN|nr:hypothetical protein LR48_Vigan553s002900 [Vigna angularis]